MMRENDTSTHAEISFLKITVVQFTIFYLNNDLSQLEVTGKFE
jgi:hypothetical protein